MVDRPPTGGGQRWTGPLLAGGLFTAWLFPALNTFGERFLGVEYVDHYGTQWFYWYAGEILRGLQSPAHTDLFFHPWGKDIYGHTGSNLLDAWLAQPLLAVFGAVAGYNYFVAALVAVNVVLGARLARRFTDDGVAAWTSGALLGLQPFLLSELMEGRPTQVLLAFLLLFFDRALALREHGRWRDAVAAGVLLALTGHTYWFYALFAGFAAIGIGWKRPLAFAVVAAVALAGTVPFAMSLARSAASGGVPGLLDVASWSWDFVVPLTREGQLVGIYSWQPFAGGQGFWIVDAGADEHFVPRVDPFPLISWVLFAAILLRPTGLPRRLILGLTVMSALLAAGPILVFGEIGFTNPVYTLMVQVFPPLQRLWWPGRAFITVAVFLPLGAIPIVLAAAPRWRMWVAAGLLTAQGATLARAGLLPADGWDASVPAGFQCLETGPDGAVISLPYAFTQGHLYYQTTHGRPIFGGMLEDNPVFAPKEHVAIREDNAFLVALLGDEDALPAAQVSAEAKAEIGALGYRYVVLQLDAFRARIESEGMLEAAMRARLRELRRDYQTLLGTPVYEDARTVIWAPWGGEPPCDVADFRIDTETPGRTDILTPDRKAGGGFKVAHLGQSAEARTKLATLIVERDGPLADEAKRMLADPDAKSSPAGK